MLNHKQLTITGSNTSDSDDQHIASNESSESNTEPNSDEIIRTYLAILDDLMSEDTHQVCKINYFIKLKVNLYLNRYR